MSAHLEILNQEFFGLRFPYDPAYVSRVKKLENRKWNNQEKRWEVHIAHLGDVLKLFNLSNEAVDRKLLRSYQIHKIKNYQTRIIAGNVSARLSGAGIPMTRVEEATSFFVPGYRYMPLFVQGKWDGRKRLFDKRRQTFPAGLIQRVVTLLEKEGISCEVVREPQPARQPIQTATPKLELREYQQECIAAALKAKRGVLELATGSGKTAVATSIIHQLELPALFLVHTRDLLHQTREYMASQLKVEIGQVGDGRVNIQPITVATVQTCARALEIALDDAEDEERLEQDATDVQSREDEIAQYIRTVPMVFFDECHHLPADCCYSLAMETHAAEYRFGLSATPYRTDRMDLLLEAAVGPKLFRANASVLIEKGYLVAPQITFTAVPPMTIRGKRPAYQQIFEQYIVDHKYRNSLIAEQARELAKQKKSTLILVTQVRHGEQIFRLLPEAILIQGSDDAVTRQERFRELEKKERLIIIATTLADEGLDIPTLDAVILASGGKSETRALQRIGRALRCAPRKKTALVYDFMDHAPFLEDHSKRRLEIFKSEPRFTVTVQKP
jgi:superfamily II DNA or RNA helicase